MTYDGSSKETSFSFKLEPEEDTTESTRSFNVSSTGAILFLHESASMQRIEETKIKYYRFLLTDKARGQSSSAIDRNRSSLKQNPGSGSSSSSYSSSCGPHTPPTVTRNENLKVGLRTVSERARRFRSFSLHRFLFFLTLFISAFLRRRRQSAHVRA